MSRPPGDGGGPIRVLQSFPGRGAQTNPYLLQLIDALPADVSTSFFSWRTALTGQYDVLHVHWPERLLRGTSPMRTALRRAAFLALLLRLRLRDTAVFRTVHNPVSHEAGDLVERWLLRALERRTTVWHRLNPLTPVPDGAPAVTIPHGHYRDWFAGFDGGAPQPERMLFFGLVRPYKGVEELLSAFAGLDRPDAVLRLVGQPSTRELADALQARIESDTRASASWGYASDAELAAEVARSQLVVLPYRDLHNSGAALLALSLDRPVLVPENAVTQWLRAGVGDEWVHTFRPPLRADHLAAALAATSRRPVARPRLEDRGWAGIGMLHAEAYRGPSRGPGSPLAPTASGGKGRSVVQPTR